MKRKFLFPTLILFAVLVPAAAADVIIGKTSLTVRSQPALFFKGGARVVVSGQLRSSKTLCRAGRVVRLRKTEAGKTRQLEWTRTQRDGKYRFVLQPSKRERVYVFFAGLFQSGYDVHHSCQPSRSRSITVAPPRS